jgi:Flp pilus assembly protein TadG
MTMTHPRPRETKRFGLDRSGTVAVEFALLAPIMLTLFMAAIVLTNGVMAYLKVNVAAQTVADIVARQQGTVTSANVLDFGNAAREVMEPLSTAPLLLSYASVVWANGVPRPSTRGDSVSDANGSWHQEDGGPVIPVATAAALANNVCTTANTSNSAPVTSLCPDGQSVVIVMATYTYSIPFSFVSGSWIQATGFSFAETAITQPRYGKYVPHS